MRIEGKCHCGDIRFALHRRGDGGDPAIRA